MLTVEVTENSIMSDPRARPGTCCAGIRDLGIAVSIDDFGTGYSSLAYLRDLAGHRGQDRQDLRHEREPRASGTWPSSRRRPTSGTASACRSWPRASRTRRRRGSMADSGCDLLQGFLLLPPSPAAELFAWRKRPRDWAGRVVELPDSRQWPAHQVADR